MKNVLSVQSSIVYGYAACLAGVFYRQKDHQQNTDSLNPLYQSCMKKIRASN